MNRKSRTTLFYRILRLLVPFLGWVLLSILLGIGTIGSSIGLLMTASYLIAAASLHPSIAALQIAIVGVRFFGIIRGILRYAERYLTHLITFKVLQHVREWFYNRLDPLAPARIMEFRSADLFTRIISDIHTLEFFFIRLLFPPLVAVSILGLMWLIFSQWFWELGLILTIAFVLAGVVVPLILYTLNVQTQDNVIDLRSKFQTKLQEYIRGRDELWVLGSLDKTKSELVSLNQRYIRIQKQHARLLNLNEVLSTLIMNGTILALIIYLAPLINGGWMDGVYLAAIIMGVYAAFEAVYPLPDVINQLNTQIQAAQRLFQIIDAEPSVIDPTNPISVPDSYGIKCKHVHFKYPTQSIPQLTDINLTVNPGEQIALVGASGSGKSTLAHLLLRYWDIEQGNISIGGIPIRDVSLEELRCYVSMVPQQLHLFNGTLLDNITLANPQASMEQIERVLNLAGLDSFIKSLPDGIHTWCGVNGVLLSGGERQRLAIARALLKDAPIFIGDEMTAHLDKQTAHIIWNNLQPILSQKTTILISHRIYELKRVDRIYVMAHGRIIQQGTYAQLIEESGSQIPRTPSLLKSLVIPES
jgi:ATP-binding cassette, subfamily C, bacterial CydC